MNYQAIELNLKLPFKIEKKGDIYISSCPILDVFSQGATIDESKKNIIEALKAFLTGCLELGTLEAVLKECGFRPSIKENLPISKDEYVDVPIELLANSKDLYRCHA